VVETAKMAKTAKPKRRRLTVDEVNKLMVEGALTELDRNVSSLTQDIAEATTVHPAWFLQVREVRARLEEILSHEPGVADGRDDEPPPPVDPVERLRVPARSQERWWAEYAALVERETGLPVEHPGWILLASRHVGAHLEHDRLAQDEAAKRARFLRDQLRAWAEQCDDETYYRAVRQEVHNRDGVSSPPSFFELVRRLPYTPWPAVVTRATWVDALCREYEAATELVVQCLEWIARQARVDDATAAPQAPGPQADRELNETARSLHAVISHRWPRCRKPWHVTAALMRCHGWEWGCHGPLAKRAAALQKRVTRSP
jgi:hypothetical protein